jgi:aspartyl-tRNA(Asn)/glutamyl-tRNA(Gln) amidotransferase subunit A
MLDVSKLTLHAASNALEKGETSARELCQAVLDRIETVDDSIQAYLHVDRDAALTAADAADGRRAKGSALSSVDGVPIAVKDNIAVTGQPCGCASKILDGFVSTYDATVVKALRKKGMVLLGRTNMDEFAMGSTCENSGIKPTSNPHAPDRVPGGSSGGSAAAVAAGEAIAALGSDTGGSIRQPAGFCGVVGMKPTYGRVSRYGLVAFASSLDQIGPLTHDVHDSALLLEAIAGHDPMDSTSLPDPCENLVAAATRMDVRGMRLGMPKEYFESEGLSPEVRTAVENAAKKLESQGAEIVEVHLPHSDYAIGTYYIIATAEASANLARFDGVRYGFRDRAGEESGLLDMYRLTRANGFGSEVKRRVILGTYVLSSGYYDAYYLHAQKVRTLIRRDFEAAFEQCDAILAPTSPTTACKKGALATPLEMYLQDIYTISANLAGICGISLPCGADADGLPIGLQILGPALGEAAILRTAAAVEIGG